MGIRRRLWCYAVLADPGSWFVPLLLLWVGIALAIKGTGWKSFIWPFHPRGLFLILLLFLGAVNILEKSLEQMFRGATLEKRFMGSVSIFEAILVSVLLIVLGFQITAYKITFFTFFTILVFASLVLFYLPPFSLKKRGIISNIFQAFLFGFLVPLWGSSLLKPFPRLDVIFVGTIFLNYLFGVYLTRDYINSLKTTPKGLEKNLFAEFKKWELILIALFITLPFLFLPLGIYFHIIQGQIAFIAGLGFVLFLYGLLILIYFMRLKEINRGNLAKIQFHLFVILIIAVIFLVRF